MEDVKFKLEKTIKLANGNEINELTLKFAALTCADLKTANRICNLLSSGGIANADSVGTLSPRLNPELRTAIGFVAGIKGTPGLMVDDILQLSLADGLELSEIVLSDYLFR